jgi:outer membrane murein-binding lipoprotein Lpp
MKRALALTAVLMSIALTSACSSGGGSASVDSFCTQAKAADSTFSSLGSTASDSEQGIKLFEDLANKAPSEIKNDMNTILNALKSPTSTPSSSQTADLNAASERLAQFFNDKCHLNLGSADSGSKFSTVGSSISN